LVLLTYIVANYRKASKPASQPQHVTANAPRAKAQGLWLQLSYLIQHV